MTSNGQPTPRTNLAIVLGWKKSGIETFVRAHIERLPADVTILHGRSAHIGDSPVLSQSVGSRLGRKLLRVVRGRDWEYEFTYSFVKAFRDSHCQAVLAEYGPTGVDVMDACAEANLPLIVHFHGFDASRNDILSDYATGYRRLFRQAAALIAVSRPMYEALQNLGAPEQKLHLNPYGVDLELFCGARPEQAPPNFVSVGRFTEKKAPFLTLLAFQRVRSQQPAARLTMIGDGHLRLACRDLAKALHIDEAVSFPGTMSPVEIQACFRRARAVVQHSIVAADGDSEGTPVALLEAGASGLPVVATRHAGIPDAVPDGKSGLLVDELDVDAMAAAMLRLARDPALAAELGRAAREHIAAHYNIQDSIGRLWQIIESCLPAAQKST